MKTALIADKSRTNSIKLPRQPGARNGGHRNPAGVSPRTEKNRIQWPTPEVLQRVATTLIKVSRAGMRQENAGDYFISGDLAYQLQEIIRATDELLKKCQRNQV